MSQSASPEMTRNVSSSRSAREPHRAGGAERRLLDRVLDVEPRASRRRRSSCGSPAAGTRRVTITSSKPCSRSSSRMCSMHGLPTIGTIGFGWFEVSGRRRVPSPPAMTTAFMSPPPRRALRSVAGAAATTASAEADPEDARAASRCPRGVTIMKPSARVEQPGRGLAERSSPRSGSRGRRRAAVRRASSSDVARGDQQRDPRQAVGVPEQDHRRVDHQPVGERVGDLAERRLDVPAAREEAVDLVGDAGGAEERSPPASCGRRRTSRISTAKTGISDEPRDRQRVRKLRERRGDGAGGHACKDTRGGRDARPCRAS